MDEDRVRAAVDRAFVDTGAGAPPWPDPRPQGEPAEDEYSRCLDPAKYRIVGARVEAWLHALANLGLATVSDVEDPSRAWRGDPPHGVPTATRARWVRPTRAGGVPLLVGLRDLDGVPDAIVALGAGDPAVPIALVPMCGCDACDHGSDALLAELDEHVLDVVSGALVHVAAPGWSLRGRRNGWSADGLTGPGQAEQLLAEARSGRSPHPVVHGACWW